MVIVLIVPQPCCRKASSACHTEVVSLLQDGRSEATAEAYELYY